MTSETLKSDILKDKAMLLLRREREVFQFRQERARTETWLAVFHVLSLQLQEVDASNIAKLWAKLLIDKLGFQVAGVYHRDHDRVDGADGAEVAGPVGDAQAGDGRGAFKGEWGEPAARFAPSLVLDADVVAFLAAKTSGRYVSTDAPSDTLRKVSEAIGLTSFYWVYLSVNGRDLLLVAGFCQDAAQFHTLNDTDEGHFLMFSSHLGSLLNNVWLLGNLERDRSKLEKSNRELDESLHALRVAQRQLVKVSRTAGMAEIATGVLHNVGNILTSVDLSSELIGRKLGEMRLRGLRKSLDLLDENAADLGSFFTKDPRGMKLVPYLRKLLDALEGERDEIAAENEQLRKRIDHIKMVIAKQQEYAKPLSVIEVCSVRELIDEAIALVHGECIRQGVDLRVRVDAMPDVGVDRHQVLQILVNLLGNARHATVDSDRPDKVVEIAADAHEDSFFSIRVRDNGVGIAPENLVKLFQHGFTTKKSGHGFGLHNAHLAAKGMGGDLRAFSDGAGRGAEFVLRLPISTGVTSPTPLPSAPEES